MKKGIFIPSDRTNTEKTLNGLSFNSGAPKLGFVLLLLLYIASFVAVVRTSISAGSSMLFGQAIPYHSLTGAFSSFGNLCIIFLAVFYGKTGYFLSLALILTQFPMILTGMFAQQSFTNIAGFFTNLLTLLAIILLRANMSKVEKYQTRLRNQAVTDQLTGLPNRFACSELMGDLVRRNEKFVIAVLNLNNFKSVNSTMGEGTGNALLVEIAARWRDIADRGVSGTLDFVTRQGGDEFAFIIRNCDSDENIRKTLTYYEAALRNKLTVEGCDYFLTASIGYAVFPADGGSSDVLLARAYSALAEAKRANAGDSIHRFRDDLPTAEHALETERRIRSALEENRLFFHLQPQYDISHRRRGFDALARIKNPDGSLLSPGEFIPVAEKAGLIDKIDYTVFRDAAGFLGKLIRQTHTDVTLSVNVSVKYLMKNDFLKEVQGILDTCGVPPSQLEVEITESVMIDSVEKALQCIGELKKMGVRIAIDDFGTGYSSLSYLNSFPADTLKVDKAFIDKMNTGEASRRYVAAIISIGHLMGFDVISEGVEEQSQLDTLREIGCDYIQGYVWGRPMPPEAAEELLAAPTH